MHTYIVVYTYTYVYTYLYIYILPATGILATVSKTISTARAQELLQKMGPAWLTKAFHTARRCSEVVVSIYAPGSKLLIKGFIRVI